MDGALRVIAGGSEHRVAPGETFTFGRAASCTVRIAPDDPTISRLAGAVACDGAVWLHTNRSRSRPLTVVDRYGLRSVLAPGGRVAVEARMRVIVVGAASHELVLDGPVTQDPPVPDGAAGLPTAAGEGVLINRLDRLALVALFAGYLQDGRRYDPNPRKYSAAAARLGWPRTTLVKRIEYLRARLTRAGVPDLHGANALPALAEYVLTTGVINRDDLKLLNISRDDDAG